MCVDTHTFAKNAKTNVLIYTRAIINASAAVAVSAAAAAAGFLRARCTTLFPNVIAQI